MLMPLVVGDGVGQTHFLRAVAKPDDRPTLLQRKLGELVKLSPPILGLRLTVESTGGAN